MKAARSGRHQDGKRGFRPVRGGADTIEPHRRHALEHCERSTLRLRLGEGPAKQKIEEGESRHKPSKTAASRLLHVLTLPSSKVAGNFVSPRCFPRQE